MKTSFGVENVFLVKFQFILALSVLVVVLASFDVHGSEPISPSFTQIKSCYPMLAREELSFKVDLEKLKDIVDENFVTLKTTLRFRKIIFKTQEQIRKRATLKVISEVGTKVNYQLFLEKLDEQSVGTSLPLKHAQKYNPSQKIIAELMLDSEIESDEYYYVDTKLNGYLLGYKKRNKMIHDLELLPQPGRKNEKILACEKTDHGAVVCTCKAS